VIEKLIKKIGLGLDKAKIPYMIIGGQAVLLYGSPKGSCGMLLGDVPQRDTP